MLPRSYKHSFFTLKICHRTLDAIPIIAYHDTDEDKAIDSTDTNLFDQEMKYLHDNGFKVMPMSDIGYNENTKYMYIK